MSDQNTWFQHDPFGPPVRPHFDISATLPYRYISPPHAEQRTACPGQSDRDRGTFQSGLSAPDFCPPGFRAARHSITSVCSSTVMTRVDGHSPRSPSDLQFDWVRLCAFPCASIILEISFRYWRRPLKISSVSRAITKRPLHWPIRRTGGGVERLQRSASRRPFLHSGPPARNPPSHFRESTGSIRPVMADPPTRTGPNLS